MLHEHVSAGQRHYSPERRIFKGKIVNADIFAVCGVDRAGVGVVFTVVFGVVHFKAVQAVSVYRAAACYSNIPCIFCVKQTPPKLAGRAQTLAWRVQRILAVILRADQFCLRIKEECRIRVDAQRTGKECSVRQIHSPAHARSVIQRPLDRFRVECPPIACRAVWCLRYIIELPRRQQMSCKGICIRNLD